MFWERSDSTLSDETLKSFSTDCARFDTVNGAIEAILGPSPVGFTFTKHLKRGTFNDLWHMQTTCDRSGRKTDRVLRLNFHPYVSQAYHLEQWVNNEAIAREFPTPRIVHVDTSRAHCQYPFQVIEYSDGAPLRGQDEEVVRKALSQLGQALRKLHDKPVGDRFGRVSLGTVPEWDMFWPISFDHVKYCLTNRLIHIDEAFEIERKYMDKYLILDQPSLLHADLSYDNILLDPATKDLKAVIDWEDAILGDPIFELAGLATFHPEERHVCFLDAYYEGRERPDDFEYRFWIYYLRIALAKAVHRHRFGYSDAGGEGRQPADGRITLALARLKDLA